jgi:hypothetical protein
MEQVSLLNDNKNGLQRGYADVYTLAIFLMLRKHLAALSNYSQLIHTPHFRQNHSSNKQSRYMCRFQRKRG